MEIVILFSGRSLSLRGHSIALWNIDLSDENLNYGVFSELLSETTHLFFCCVLLFLEINDNRNKHI